jgi:starch synthase
VLTVHNARYHGASPWWAAEGAGLPAELFRGDCDHGGSFNSLKAAVLAADFVTTVSPSHARDLVEDPESSGGLDYVFRQVEDRLAGILNGIDVREWDPAHDASRPLLAYVGRLVAEKGIDLLIEAVPRIVARDPRPQLVVLGSGSARYEDALAKLERVHADSVRMAPRYDDALAHRLFAGADVLLVPSWFEPCGLVQMYAMRYGTVPVVYPTGGLADSVRPFDPRTGTGTGAWMERHDARALAAAVRSVLGWWRQPETWGNVQRNGMTADLSWAAATDRYLEAYERVLA